MYFLINSITGTVNNCLDNQIIINCNAFSFSIFTPHPSSFSMGTTVTLYTILLWKQDSDPQLVGFSTIEERNYFTLLTECSGIGTKLAITILESADLQNIFQAIVNEDISFFKNIHGCGEKKAEAIIFELKKKIKKHPIILKNSECNTNFSYEIRRDLEETLISLGYSDKQIKNAINEVTSSIKSEKNPSFTNILRTAIQYIGKNI